MPQDTAIIDMFDHLCWYLCSSREGFCPPDETSAMALADRETDEMEEAASRGYHRGSLAHLDGVADFIEMYDIDVEARADRYAENHDMEPPKTRDELTAVMDDCTE
jgi:hypothetical protein